MAAKTQESLSGTPSRQYGSFSGRSAGSGHPVGKIVQPMLAGTPGRRYGSFAGRSAGGGGSHPVGRITQPSRNGRPGRRYGSFAGRSPSGGVAAGGTCIFGGHVITGYLEYL